MNPADVFLTTEDVAARYRTVASSVRQWRYDGTGPVGARYGRRVLYRLSDLLAWEQKKRAEEAAAA